VFPGRDLMNVYHAALHSTGTLPLLDSSTAAALRFAHSRPGRAGERDKAWEVMRPGSAGRGVCEGRIPAPVVGEGVMSA